MAYLPHYIFHQVRMSQSVTSTPTVHAERKDIVRMSSIKSSMLRMRSLTCIYNWACAMKCELFFPPVSYVLQTKSTYCGSNRLLNTSVFYFISIFWTSSRYALISEDHLEQTNTNVVQKVVLGFKWLKILLIYIEQKSHSGWLLVGKCYLD